MRNTARRASQSNQIQAQVAASGTNSRISKTFYLQMLTPKCLTQNYASESSLTVMMMLTSDEIKVSLMCFSFLKTVGFWKTAEIWKNGEKTERFGVENTVKNGLTEISKRSMSASKLTFANKMFSKFSNLYLTPQPALKFDLIGLRVAPHSAWLTNCSIQLQRAVA